MKHSILSLLTFLFLYSSALYAQNSDQHPLQDAVDYNTHLTDGDYEQARAILEKYNLDKIATADTLVDTIIGTRFIDVPETINMQEARAVDVGESQAGDVSSGIGAPAMIDELSKLIADRFREELTLAFLDNFREKLQADTLLGDLFPNAKRILLFDDPFNYQAWLASFRSALDEDLKELPENLPILLKGISTIDGINLTQAQKDFIDAATVVYEQVLPFVQSPQESYKNTNELLDFLSVQFKNENVEKSLDLIGPIVKELCNYERTVVARQWFA